MGKVQVIKTYTERNKTSVKMKSKNSRKVVKQSGPPGFSDECVCAAKRKSLLPFTTESSLVT